MRPKQFVNQIFWGKRPQIFHDQIEDFKLQGSMERGSQKVNQTQRYESTWKVGHQSRSNVERRLKRREPNLKEDNWVYIQITSTPAHTRSYTPTAGMKHQFNDPFIHPTSTHPIHLHVCCFVIHTFESSSQYRVLLDYCSRQHNLPAKRFKTTRFANQLRFL